MYGRIGVLEGPKSIAIEEYPVPDPEPDEALLRIDLAGLDGTDVKAYEGTLPDSTLSRYPQVMGDEILGTIESIGEKARERYGVTAGDRVIVGPRITCGNCEFCQTGNHAHCDEMTTYGRLDPREPPHFTGGCGEYLLIQPGSSVYSVPDPVSDKAAVLASVTIADGLRSAALADVEAGDAVAVIGPGPQGLACVLGAQTRGAERIVAIGLPADRNRLEMAERLGATDTVVTGSDGLASLLEERLGNSLVDTVFECTGNASVVEEAVEVVKPGGTCQFVTMAPGEATIDPFDLVMREISLIPRRGPTPCFVYQALRVARTGRAPIADILTNQYALDDISEACQAAGEGARSDTDVLKVGITPHK
jgi:alcohol dehydrogenase